MHTVKDAHERAMLSDPLAFMYKFIRHDGTEIDGGDRKQDGYPASWKPGLALDD